MWQYRDGIDAIVGPWRIKRKQRSNRGVSGVTVKDKLRKRAKYIMIGVKLEIERIEWIELI